MRVLAITGGHSFDRAGFEAFLGALPFDMHWVEQPEAQDWLDPARLSEFGASLHYDMPGVRTDAGMAPDRVITGVAGLVAAGHGFVVLHHAIASWPGWPGWSELVGGQYLYAPQHIRGQDWPDSGYRLDVVQRLTPALPEHPVLAGLTAGFEITDETYLCPVFTDSITPLLQTDAELTDQVHWSTVHAMAGRRQTRDGWQHPAGVGLAAWTRQQGQSRLVYVQPGDTAQTLSNPHYQLMVTNALNWVDRQRSGR